MYEACCWFQCVLVTLPLAVVCWLCSGILVFLSPFLFLILQSCLKEQFYFIKSIIISINLNNLIIFKGAMKHLPVKIDLHAFEIVGDIL